MNRRAEMVTAECQCRSGSSSVGNFGGPRRTRTCDPLIKSPGEPPTENNADDPGAEDSETWADRLSSWVVLIRSIW